MVRDPISIWTPRLKITRPIPNLMPNLCLFRLVCWFWSIQSLIVEDFMWQACATHPLSHCECALVVGELGQRFIIPLVTAMWHRNNHSPMHVCLPGYRQRPAHAHTNYELMYIWHSFTCSFKGPKEWICQILCCVTFQAQQRNDQKEMHCISVITHLLTYKQNLFILAV